MLAWTTLQPQAPVAKRGKRRNNESHQRKSRNEGGTESRATQMKEEIKELRSNKMKE